MNIPGLTKLIEKRRTIFGLLLLVSVPVSLGPLTIATAIVESEFATIPANEDLRLPPYTARAGKFASQVPSFLCLLFPVIAAWLIQSGRSD